MNTYLVITTLGNMNRYYLIRGWDADHAENQYIEWAVANNITRDTMTVCYVDYGIRFDTPIIPLPLVTHSENYY